MESNPKFTKNVTKRIGGRRFTALKNSKDREPLKILISTEKYLAGVTSSFIKKSILQCAQTLSSEIPLGVTEVSIVLTSDIEIQKLNKEYRKKDKPTDVLSFPQFSKKELTQKILSGSSLGDIVISVDTTVRQAKFFEVSTKQEFSRLLVHGFLHLLGYDHESVLRKEAQRMKRKEKMLLGMIEC